MKGDVDTNFWCPNLLDREDCTKGIMCKYCRCIRHKHPTLKQFREEYGEEYSDDGAVWWRMRGRKGWNNWSNEPVSLGSLINNMPIGKESDYQIACACTPWGKPPNSWRPE
jgi:hypothetical protein